MRRIKQSPFIKARVTIDQLIGAEPIQFRDYRNNTYAEFNGGDQIFNTPIDDETGMILFPVPVFGTQNLYAPINYHTFNNIMQILSDNKHDMVYKTTGFIISKIIGDSPISVGQNAKYVFSSNWLNRAIQEIMVYAYQSLFGAMNDFYKIQNLDMTAVITPVESNDHEVIDKLYEVWENRNFEEATKLLTSLQVNNYFADQVRAYPDGWLIDLPRYIVVSYTSRKYYKMNNIPRNFYPNDMVFCRIPKTCIYQQISFKRFKNLMDIQKMSITLSKVDSQRNPTQKNDVMSFILDCKDPRDIINVCTMFCTDMDLNSIFGPDREDLLNGVRSKEYTHIFGEDYERCKYDAISIGIEQFGTTANVTLTQEELGINPIHRVRHGAKYFYIGDRPNDSFNLLNLVMKVAKLHKSMKNQ